MTLRRDHLAIGVLILGFTQMVGHILGIPILRALGLATGFAPFPRVFCAVHGYEAFAAGFELEWAEETGLWNSRSLTPAWYAQIEGPYNRRNVYGAALAFAPHMEPCLRQAVMAYALQPGSCLRVELGIPHEAPLRVRITPRQGEESGPWLYTMPHL